MKVIEIAFTVLPVTDLRIARRFYEDVLKLTPTQIFEKEGMGFIEYDIASGTLAIGSGAPLFKPTTEGGGAIALEVENFDEALAHLKANGCDIKMDAYATPVCHMAVVADPDGNLIMIHKRKSAE